MKTFIALLPHFGRICLLVLLLFCWSWSLSLYGQTTERTNLEIPNVHYEIFQEGMDPGLERYENQLVRMRGDFLVKLDTIKQYSPRDGQTVLSLMYVYEFNENNNNTKRATFGIRPNIGFTQVNELKAHYDHDNFRISDTIYIFDLQGMMHPSTYRDYEYNQHGLVTEITTRSWNVNSGIWNFSFKTVNEYEGEVLTKQSFYEFDGFTGEFSLWQFIEWEYDEGFLTSRNTYLLNDDDGTFDIIVRNLFEYNDDGLLTVSEVFNRLNPENLLRPSHRLEFSFNVDGLVALQTRLLPVLPQTNGLEWKLSEREETSYTVFGKPEITILSDWIENEEEWEAIQRVENIYDLHENILHTRTYFPNLANPGQWLLDRDEEYEYNYDFESGAYLTDPELVDAGSHMITSIITQLVNPNRLGFRNEYIYSDITVNTSDFNEKSDIVLFPNPVKDILSIRFEQGMQFDRKISIMDIKGRIFYQNNFNGIIDISTAQWPAGTYSVVLTAFDGTKVISRQFVKH